MVISPRKSAGWHAQTLARCVTSILYTRTVVTCFPSNRTIFLVLVLANNFQHTARLGLPIPMLCLPSCPRRARILKGRHLVYAKLLPSGFPILIFLLLRIECMSFAPIYGNAHIRKPYMFMFLCGFHHQKLQETEQETSQHTSTHPMGKAMTKPLEKIIKPIHSDINR